MAKLPRDSSSCDVEELLPVKCDDRKCSDHEYKPISAAEHLVLFSMPYLQGDQEAKILHALYDLQYQFDGVSGLIVGRVQNDVEKFTHALLMRFPTLEKLKEYYKSEALANVACLMKYHLYDEITVDYISSAGLLDTCQKDPISATVTLLRRKKDVWSGEMDCGLHSLKGVAGDTCFVEDFTFGSNLFIRGDKLYTHGFAAYVKSVSDLIKLADHAPYSKVLHQKVLPLSCLTISVNVLAFKPIKSCL